MSDIRVLLELNGQQPVKLIVRDLSALSRPAEYGIIADYGHAECILCSGMTRANADDVAYVMASRIGCIVQLAESP